MPLIVVLMLMVGCAPHKEMPPTITETHKPTISQSEEPPEKSETEKPVEIEQDDSEDVAESVDDACERYAELYSASHIVHDLYMYEKAWLVGDNNIVQVVSIAGYDDVVVLSRESVERVEHSIFSDFASVTIFDKSGKSISIMLPPEDVPHLLKRLE